MLFFVVNLFKEKFKVIWFKLILIFNYVCDFIELRYKVEISKIGENELIVCDRFIVIECIVLKDNLIK